jgi:hypothetical protein
MDRREMVGSSLVWAHRATCTALAAMRLHSKKMGVGSGHAGIILHPVHHRTCDGRTPPGHDPVQGNHGMNRQNPHLRKLEGRLRDIAESPVFAGLLPVSAAIAATAMLGVWWIDDQNLRVLRLFAAVGSGIVVIAAWASAGHLRNAAAGTRRGRREPATPTLRKEPGDHTAPD